MDRDAFAEQADRHRHELRVPYPDRLLDLAAPGEHGPDAIEEARETIEPAFLAAIQHLPARQRAVVILRDVLFGCGFGWVWGGAGWGLRAW